jgi:hypothetical protein
METQAIVVAIALGALLAAWAVAYFNDSQPLQEIRFSVPQQRYFAALGAHVSAIFAIYALLVVVIYGMIMLATVGVPFDCYRYLPNVPSGCESVKAFKVLNREVLVWSALGAVLFVRLALPNVPIIRRLAERVRDLTHELALFPFARDSLVCALSASGFAARDQSVLELGEELARYGVASRWLSCLSRSAARSLLEVHSLRSRLIGIFDRLPTFAAALPYAPRRMSTSLAAQLEAATATKTVSSSMLRRFGCARAAAFVELETGFRRLIRRTALALLLVEELSEKVDSEALCRSVSNFVVEECNDVRLRYRRLVVEAALSCVPHREERTQFLKYFGYDVPIPPSLPLRPWIIVFVLDFLLFLIPSVIIIFTGGKGGQPPTPLVLFPLVHAISQSVAITWAIYPKVVPSNFARPSLYSLPWHSYIVFGLGSYVTGAVILLLFRLLVPMPYPIILPTLLSSLSFLLMAVGISVLIDLRLQSRSLEFEQGRVRDGVVMALILLANSLTFQLVMFHVGPRLGWVDAKLLVAVGVDPHVLPFIRTTFLLLSPSLGFVIGYYVPAAAAAFLQKANLLGATDHLEQLHPSETTWERRLSPQA